MKLLFAVMVLALGALALLAPTKDARADWWADMYQVQCVPELDMLELRPFNVNSKIATHAIEQRNKSLEPHNERIEKEHNLYVPHWHYRDDDDSVRYDLHGNRIYPGGMARWSARFTCKLSVGLVDLVILPEPLSDESEWFESISVSMLVNDRLILHDIPFRRCEDNAAIYALVYQGGNFLLSGRFGWMASVVGDASKNATRSGLKSFRVEPGPIDVAADYGLSAHESSRNTAPLLADDILNPVPPHHARGEEENYHCWYRSPGGLTPYREWTGW